MINLVIDLTQRCTVKPFADRAVKAPAVAPARRQQQGAEKEKAGGEKGGASGQKCALFPYKHMRRR
jgi:hypothetical protein